MFSLHFDLACKTGWDEDTTSNKCLKAFTGDANKMTWQNAQRKCEEQGLNGNLASLGSQDIVLRKFKGLFTYDDSYSGTYLVDQIMTKSGLWHICGHQDYDV